MDSFSERREVEYERLGFKCGIEIHQQLDTHKLFCSCPSIIREDEPDIFVERRMRAVAGELGDVDPAALHEFLKGRVLLYQAYSDSNCLVELDEEPPHPLNQEALDIAIKLSLLLHAKLVPELQVMRKTVINGSNTSGFQRTVLIAHSGYVETSKGKVNIPYICLEEDAAREVKVEGEERIVYRLDRLGIPLIEIGTEATIKSPEHARETAEKLGQLLRSGRVKRGLGTIRQDLNVSIAEGERIEIKGVQDLHLLQKIIEGEVQRQLMLLDVRKELLKRASNGESEIKDDFRDLTHVFSSTNSILIKKMLEQGKKIMGVKLPWFKGLLKNKLGPEIAQYVRASSKARGIFHSDELPAYGISEREVKKISEMLNVGEKDAFVLLVEEEEEAIKALGIVTKRARLAFLGVPKETRRAKPDGSTEYMRPLPGSARMYPETDVPLIVVDKNRVEKLKANLPERPEKRKKRYEKLGLSSELAEQMLHSRRVELFDKLVKTFPKLKPSLIATTILSTPKEVKRRYNLDVDVELLNEEHFSSLFSLLSEGRIGREAIPEILLNLLQNPNSSAEEIAERENLWLLSEREVRKMLEEMITSNKTLIQKEGEKAFPKLMGCAMREFRGRADPKVVQKLLKELMTQQSKK